MLGRHVTRTGEPTLTDAVSVSSKNFSTFVRWSMTEFSCCLRLFNAFVDDCNRMVESLVKFLCVGNLQREMYAFRRRRVFV